MPNVEERLASLDGRMAEQTQLFSMIRDALAALERRMETRFDTIDRRFEVIDRRFETIEAKLSHHLFWTVGIQVTVLVVVIGSLVAVLTG